MAIRLPSNLSELLGDVDITAPADGQIVRFDAASGKWINLAAPFATAAELSAHTADTTNPHAVTAAQIGALALTGGTLSGEVHVENGVTMAADAPIFFGDDYDANVVFDGVDLNIETANGNIALLPAGHVELTQGLFGTGGYDQTLLSVQDTSVGLETFRLASSLSTGTLGSQLWLRGDMTVTGNLSAQTLSVSSPQFLTVELQYMGDTSQTVVLKNLAGAGTAGFRMNTGDHRLALNMQSYTADREVYLPDATGHIVLADGSGSLALTGGIGLWGTTPPASQPTGYTTPANLTTDRTFDANNTTVAELADVLGTLIEDLKTTGIIAA